MASHTLAPATTYLTADDQWAQILARLPADLETSVLTAGAILRHREINTAPQYLRLIFAYACNLPLSFVVTWAAALGLASLGEEALRKRIRVAGHWLHVVLLQVLAARTPLPTPMRLRLRLTDGSQAASPGAKGTEFRLHFTFDLFRQRVDAIELTDAHQGEGLHRSAPQPGDVVVGDRNYGTRAGVLATVLTGAAVLVRIGWTRFPLVHREGTPFDLLAEIRTMLHDTVQAWEVRMIPQQRTDPVVLGRFIACRLPADLARLARERAQKAHAKSAKKNKSGRKAQIQPGTIESAEYLLLFTTLPALVASAAQVVALYRFRWQIELAIKRMKSLLGLAALTARHPDLVRAVLLAKLLLVLLVDDLCEDAVAFSPSGRRRPAAPLPVGGVPVSLGDASRDYRRDLAVAVLG